MSGSLDQNGVAERRKPNIIDMVLSMLSSFKIPKSLWIESLKVVAYILNQISIKAVPKKLFELFKG